MLADEGDLGGHNDDSGGQDDGWCLAHLVDRPEGNRPQRHHQDRLSVDLPHLEPQRAFGAFKNYDYRSCLNKKRKKAEKNIVAADKARVQFSSKHFYSIFRVSGSMRTKKSRFPLPRVQSCQRFSFFEACVGEGVAMHSSPPIGTPARQISA